MTSPRTVALRVWVPDVWDVVNVDVSPSASVTDVKRQALQRALGGRPEPDAYEVKFRGALVIDEHRTVAELGARDGTPMIVLPARRRPVR
ncbi:MAG: hypothetical protein A2W29_10585 [Gemmatimonadetes bacterium RBG_16_66_8]|nr:MAG: hypothetical protein A2W29_10585 [Gemmatimonadetes bacterium RBG_16_66_8]